MEIYKPQVREESIRAILDGSKKFQYLLIEEEMDEFPDEFVYKINGEYYLLKFLYHYNGYTGDFYDMVTNTRPDHDTFCYMIEKKWYKIDLIKQKKNFCVYEGKKTHIYELTNIKNVICEHCKKEFSKSKYEFRDDICQNCVSKLGPVED